jgi:hypothetical protein
LEILERAFHCLAAQVPPPREVPWADLGFVHRYIERLPHQALILKLARQVSGLFAIDTLLFHGLAQEQGVIQRTLDEIGEDIFVLVAGLQRGFEPLHHQLLEAFWEEEFDNPRSAVKSTQKRAPPPRRKIHAFLARFEGGDVSSAQAINRTLSKAYSGYVHAAAPHIMDIYGGRPPHFYVSGVAGTSRHLDHIEDARNYFYRGLLSVILVARAFGDADTDREVGEFVKHFEKKCGTKFFTGKGSPAG